MKKVYVKLVAYNPAENRVTAYIALDVESASYDRDASQAFYKINNIADTTTDIILGKTLSGDFCQLSTTPYGSYIKEDATSVNRFLDKSKLLVAIANYQKEKNIPFTR